MVVSILKLMNSSSKLIPLMWKKRSGGEKANLGISVWHWSLFTKSTTFFFLPIILFSQIYSLWLHTKYISYVVLFGTLVYEICVSRVRL